MFFAAVSLTVATVSMKFTAVRLLLASASSHCPVTMWCMLIDRCVVTTMWQCDVYCIMDWCVDRYVYAWCELRITTMWRILYTLVHLHKHTHETFPLKIWIVIWCQSTGSYVKWIDWLQRKDVGLLDIGWHDRRGQHGWVAKWHKAMIMDC